MEPSPYSIRGITKKIGEAADAVTKPFRKPEGYTPATQEQPPAAAPAPAAAAPAPQLGGMNLGAIRKREEAAGMKDGGCVKRKGYAHGGLVKGPGTGTSDSIPRNVKPGTYIMPADSTKTVMHMKAGGCVRPKGYAGGGTVPVKLSNGETQINPDQVHAIGAKVLDMVRGATHVKAKGAKRHPDKEGKREDKGESKAMETSEMPMMANGGKIGPIDKGGFHRWLGKKEGQPITQVDINRGLASKDEHVRKMAQFAANARHFDHSKGGYADGGEVDDPNKKPPTYGEQMSKVGGALADAAGTVVKTVVGAPGYGLNKVTGAGTLSPEVASTVAPPPVVSPKVVAPVTVPRATDSQTAYPLGQQQVAVPNGYTGPAGTPSAIDPNVRTVVDANGGTLLTNSTGTNDAALLARGAVRPQNQVAMDNIQVRQDTADAARAAAQPTAAASPIILADTGGYGLRDKGVLRGRELAMNAESAAANAARNGRAGRALADGTARASTEFQNELTTGPRLGAEARGRDATTRYVADAGLAGHRMAADVASARLGVEAPKVAADTQHVKQQVEAQAQLVAAQRVMNDPNATPADRQRAQDLLLASKGKTERDTPSKYTVVPGGQSVIDGQTVKEPARVFDNQTGQFVDQQGAKPAAPKFEVNKVYQDAKGNKAKWDGSKFVPA